MKEHPKVSVIIPCYNHGRYIGEAVDSVLAQTFQGFEIIITDDCSNDGTTPAQIKEVAKKDERIKIVTLAENSGLPAARNVAITEAKGTYILPLDADDMITPDCLEKSTDAIEAGKGDIIYWSLQGFGSSKEVIIARKNVAKSLPFINCLPVCSLYKKADWKQFGGYNDNMREGYEDWNFWLCFVENKRKFYPIYEILFYHRVADDSLAVSALKKHRKLKRQIRKNHPKIYSLKNHYFTARYFIVTFRKIRRNIIRLKFSKQEKNIRILGFNLLHKEG